MAMRLLMHICCANCALYPLMNVRERGIKVEGLWYNPNIHPYTEYRRRLDALRGLQELWGLDIHYADRYGLGDFVGGVIGAGAGRCSYCYRSRLEYTARRARELGMDGFTTSLLASPYQGFDAIVDIGRGLQERYGVEFFLDDFRRGWRDGVRLSKSLGLYRQRYCGCLYSQAERYGGGGGSRTRGRGA